MQRLLAAALAVVALIGAAHSQALTTLPWPDPFANPGIIGSGDVQFSLNGWDCGAGVLPTSPNGCEPPEFVGKSFWTTCMRSDCRTSSTAFLGYSTSGTPIRGGGWCYTKEPNTCRP